MVKLNALDQSAITTSGDSETAIYETVALAQYLDSIGYHRFWLAEHHNTAAFAIAAPEILIAHIAAHTKNLRIGSGGIMVPHYSPLKIAEQFRMLETLAPNRIDLGIGRAPGGDPRTAAALQAGPKAWPIEVFPQQVEMLLQFLQDAAGLTGAAGGFPADHPYQGIHAQPMGGAAMGAPCPSGCLAQAAMARFTPPNLACLMSMPISSTPIIWHKPRKAIGKILPPQLLWTRQNWRSRFLFWWPIAKSKPII